MKETLRRCKEGIIEPLPSNTPGPLSSQYEKPDKPTAIKSHKSRFNYSNFLIRRQQCNNDGIRKKGEQKDTLNIKSTVLHHGVKGGYLNPV